MLDESPRKIPVAGDAVAGVGGDGKARRGKRGPQVTPVPASWPEENQKVIHIVRRLQKEADKHLARKRPSWIVLSLALVVALPTFIAGIYYGFIAADRYVSEARFAVRSNDAQVEDVLGMFTGMPRATVTSDSYIVADYVVSREMVEELDRRVSLRKIYQDDKADYLSRLGKNVGLEDLIHYWTRHVDVFFDSTKGTVSVSVQAFSPDAAERLATEIVDVLRRLVNDLSASARRDAVQFASSEVARAELRVKGARDDILAFRTSNNNFDPTATAQAAGTIVAGLEQQRSELNSQLAAVSGYLSADAPSVQVLKARIAAIADESARIQETVSHQAPTAAAGGAVAAPGTAGKDPGMAALVAQYQELLSSQQFAESAYTAALASLERSRAEADRTQTYLAVYVSPKLADEATYPRRLVDIFVVFVLGCLVWAIGAFGAMTVRDHMV